jgi:hypothetical protein
VDFLNMARAKALSIGALMLSVAALAQPPAPDTVRSSAEPPAGVEPLDVDMFTTSNF